MNKARHGVLADLVVCAAVDSFPAVSPTPSAAPMLHMHGVASAAAVLIAGAALMM